MGSALINGYPTEQRQVYRPMRVVERMKRMEAALTAFESNNNLGTQSSTMMIDSHSAVTRNRSSTHNTTNNNSHPHHSGGGAMMMASMNGSTIFGPGVIMGYNPSLPHDTGGGGAGGAAALGHTFGNSSMILESRGSSPGAAFSGGGGVGVFLSGGNFHYNNGGKFRSESVVSNGRASANANGGGGGGGRTHSMHDLFNASLNRGSPTPIHHVNSKAKLVSSIKNGGSATSPAHHHNQHEDTEWMYNLENLQSEFEKRGKSNTVASSHHNNHQSSLYHNKR